MRPKPFSWAKNKTKLFFRREVKRTALSEALKNDKSVYVAQVKNILTFP